MPDVAVIIPWRGGCPHRQAALEWVRRRHRCWWREPILGESSSEEWCKAEAVADGVRRCRADVLVVADADVWSDALPVAVSAVAAGAPWATTGHQVRRLTEDATRRVLHGAELDADLELDQRAYTGVVGGGIVVLSRDAWREAPLDPRFVGWGQEDEAWGYTLNGLLGPPVRLDWPGWPLWHLWHPPQERSSRSVGSADGYALARRYRAARGSRRQLAQLVEEGRAA